MTLPIAAIAIVSLLALGDAQPPAPATDAELKKMTLRELSLARNAVFAAHGRAFSTDWVREHFEKQPWYKADPKFEYARLSKAERAYVRKVKAIENAIDTEELRVRRNTVFARHGRAFKSKDLQKHFNKQPWYRVDPKYSDDRLTPDDRVEIELIQALERQAAAVPHLNLWEPGKPLSRKALDGADLNGVFEFYANALAELGVGGFSAGPCEFTLSEELCARLRSGKKTIAKLPKVDRETLATAERAMAMALARDRIAHYEHGGHHECWVNSEDEADEDRCVKAAIQEAKPHVARERARLKDARKGKHATGQQLFNEVRGVFLESMA
jgi:hypothetical protein